MMTSPSLSLLPFTFLTDRDIGLCVAAAAAPAAAAGSGGGCASACCSLLLVLMPPLPACCCYGARTVAVRVRYLLAFFSSPP